MPKNAHHKDFRFKNRNGIYSGIYRTRPDQRRSKGQRTEEDAIAWAYAIMDNKPSLKITGLILIGKRMFWNGNYRLI